ncbi:MAG: histidine kinase dimerization/phospho-acceptor domain-containing protein, partial [Pseudomonadota bacterium]
MGDKRVMMKPGLRLEIILTLTMVMVAASFLISIVVMSVTKKSILDQKVESATTLINFLQYSIDSICYGNDELFYQGENNWQLQRLTKLFTLEQEVKTIFVIDRKGRVIASNNPTQLGTIINDNDLSQVIARPKILTRLPKSSQMLFRETTDELCVSAPLFLKDRVVGAIRMTLSLQEVQRAIRKSYRLVLTYIVFNSVIIIIFGSFLLSRRIVKPIQGLAKATESIAKGDFNQFVEVGGRNEIGLLSFAFNRMGARIKEHQLQLQRQIDSLEQLNQQLQQSQKEVLASEKLALVGKLAAGIAHEIGNPLSAVLGYIGLLRRKENLDTESEDYLNRAEKELNRINKTIRGLLDFSRLQKVEITPVNLKPVIENSLSLVTHQKKFQSITLISHLDDELWPVEGDEHQFQQVILNLLLNAGDAVEPNRTIVVLADRMIWHEGKLVSCAPSHQHDIFSQVPDFGLGREKLQVDEAQFAENEPVVRIVVADNGEGISSEHLPKIFD